MRLNMPLEMKNILKQTYLLLIIISLVQIKSIKTIDVCGITVSNGNNNKSSNIISLIENSDLEIKCNYNNLSYIEYICDRKENFLVPTEHFYLDNTQSLTNISRLDDDSNYKLYQIQCSHSNNQIKEKISTTQNVNILIGKRPQCIWMNLSEWKCVLKIPKIDINYFYKMEYQEQFSHRRFYEDGWIKCGETNSTTQFISCNLYSFGKRSLFIKVTLFNDTFTFPPYIEKYEQSNSIVLIPDLLTKNVTSDSAIVYYKLKDVMKEQVGNPYINTTFLHEITYRPSFLKNWSKIEKHKKLERNQSHMHLDLNNLYPCSEYSAEVIISNKDLHFDSNLFNLRSNVKFTTNCRKPDESVQTDNSAYEINNNNLIIYWKDIQSYNKAKNFSYEISEILENNKTSKNLVDVNEWYAKFPNYNKKNEYEFHIKSRNEYGLSENFTKIYIPSEKYRPNGVQHLRKIIKTDLVQLEWIKNNPKVTDFTIFSCDKLNDQPNKCESFIDFIKISSSENIFIYKKSNILNKNFAISSNIGNISSGMTWFLCTISHEEPNYNFIVNETIKSKEIILEIVEDYCGGSFNKLKISYQEIGSDENLILDLLDFDKRKLVTISNLKPFVDYEIIISAYNDENPLGTVKKNLYKTLSDFPEKITNLNLVKLTNTSVELKWNYMEKWNGEPKKYLINITNSEYNQSITISSDLNEYTKNNLKPFSNYTIEIFAQNTNFTGNGSKIHITTNIGIPGKIKDFKRETTLENLNIFSWSSPIEKNGLIDFYEFRGYIEMNGTYHEKIIKLRSNHCTIRTNLCSQLHNKIIKFSVKAVNMKKRENILKQGHSNAIYSIKSDILNFNCVEELDEDNVKELIENCEESNECFSSEMWSNIEEIACRIPTESISLLAFYILIGILLFLIISFLVYKRKRLRKKQKNIKPILPDELYDIFDSVKLENKTKSISSFDEGNEISETYSEHSHDDFFTNNNNHCNDKITISNSINSLTENSLKEFKMISNDMKNDSTRKITILTIQDNNYFNKTSLPVSTINYTTINQLQPLGVKS